MKKWISLILACMLLIAAIPMAMAESTEEAEPIVIKEGYNVTFDPNVSTGYVVTWGYKNDNATSVTLMSQGMYSDEDKTDPNATGDIEPENYQKGNWCYPGSMISREMTKDEETGLWTISIPLGSGMFTYLYMVTEGENTYTCPDPANPQMWRNESEQPYSQVYVKYDSKYHTKNLDVMIPRTDGKTGTLEYIEYPTMNADYPTRYAGVYLPYGFDADREIPYKVLVLIHGTGGTDSEWMCGGNAPHIMDNLIAEGYVEPMIVVSMNMYENNAETRRSYLDADTINFPALLDCLLPYLVENYNVSTRASDRAVMGLSQGCSFTTYLYYKHPTEFKYFGFISGGFTSKDEINAQNILNSDDSFKYPTIMLGAGYQDMAMSGSEKMRAMFDEAGISYIVCDVEGNHAMPVWNDQLIYLVKNILWK
jgi:enterochelin esterase-like enzyme